MKAKFYTGSYIPIVGYPFLLITAERTSASEYGGDGIILISKSPILANFSVSILRTSFEASSITLSDAGIAHADDLLISTTKSLLVEKVYDLQLAALEKSPNLGAWGKPTYEESDDWFTQMLGLRLRGLSDGLIQSIVNQVLDPNWAGEIRRLLSFRPIRVVDL